MWYRPVMLLLLKIVAGLLFGGVALLVMGLLGADLTTAVSVGAVFSLFTTTRL